LANIGSSRYSRFEACNPATMICRIFYFGMVRPPQIWLTH
jgi:hypothetical protein